MSEKKRKYVKSKKRSKKVTLFPFLIPLALLILSAGTYLFFGKAELNESVLQMVPKIRKEILKRTSTQDLPPQTQTQKEILTLNNSVQKTPSQDLLPPNSTPPLALPKKESPSSLLEIVGQDLDVMFDKAGNPENSPAPPDLDEKCTQSYEYVKNFYKHLDKQSYIKTFKINTSSSFHFTQLIQELLANPPVVSRETDDLFTILQNTAHFFRIIGKDNILLLKGILDREKDFFERVLSNFYTITTIPNCSQKSFNITITKDALYDYAGFFLNTMGGRLYLFRRDSVSRLTVNYYAILIVDQANIDNNNRHGIELQPAIDSLITEIEATNAKLRLRESYLDRLYDLKEKYQLKY